MKFYKYQGTGNDFVMLDQRQKQFLPKTEVKTIVQLCDRRFGIGADGVILLKKHPDFDFEMIYFNSDGSQSFCGNGSRCAVAFAHHLKAISGNSCRFLAIDGEHLAKFSPGKKRGLVNVELKMNDVQSVQNQGNEFLLNTGSPHFVRFLKDLKNVDIVAEGRAVRYSARFKENGINVNLVCPAKNGIEIQTYERGVEGETLSCGTGVTAAAIAHFMNSKLSPGRHEIQVNAKGGNLSVRFWANPDGSFSDIWLCGPAQKVFSGNI